MFLAEWTRRAGGLGAAKEPGAAVGSVTGHAYRLLSYVFFLYYNHPAFGAMRWAPLVPAILWLQGTAQVSAGPAFAPFRSFGNYTRRTDLCADAARVARGEVYRQGPLLFAL